MMADRISSDEFFSQYAGVIKEFSTRHNLRLEKYPNDWWSAWTLLFQHPLGGVGAIDIIREEDDSLSLDLKWWIDDFDAYSRSLFTERPELRDIGGEDFRYALEDGLKTLSSWDRTKLTKVDMDYEPLWKPYKAQLANYTEQYPRPVI